MNSKKKRIMIVDDEESIRSTLTRYLNEYDTVAFSDGKEAIKCLQNEQFDILIVDFKLISMSGSTVLNEAKKYQKYYKAILITAFGTEEALKEVLKSETANWLLLKPFERESLMNIIQEALSKLEEEICSAKMLSEFISLLPGTTTPVIIHKSNKMVKLIESAKQCAMSNGVILITGESGTGKEGICNLIHYHSKRRHKPFLGINCANFTENLIDSDLFGHKKGSFSGAVNDQIGKFESLNGGTLFLDEIGELPLNLQSKLLRVIEYKEIIPIGSNESKKVDVRIICATNCDLLKMVEKGTFRKDLYYRLNVFNLYVPSLHERKEDIILLAQYFLNVIAKEESGINKTLDVEALEYLKNYDYDGNIRDLRNLIHNLYVKIPEQIIKLDHIKELQNRKSDENNDIFEITRPFNDFKVLAEKKYLLKHLEKCNFSLAKLSELMNIKASNLSVKLRELGIVLKDIRNN